MRSNEIHYRIPWRSRGYFPGHHASEQRGAGLQFRNHASLLNAPDPRRFDLRASLRDPFQQVQVKVYQQSSSIPVVVVADLSASMNYAGRNPKLGTLADFVACLSYSAYRTGDTFGFVGCADPDFPPIVVPPTLNRGAGINLADKLRKLGRFGTGSAGLTRAADYLGSRRALVFLLSDFHFEFSTLERVLRSLAYHDVVPVILWDPAEHEKLPAFGLARVVDPETRKSRLLFMRRALKRAIRERFVARFDRLAEMFRHNGREPLFIANEFNADDVSNYFLG